MERFKVTDIISHESKSTGYFYATGMIEDQWSKMSASFKSEVFADGSKVNISIERVDIPVLTSEEARDADSDRWIQSCKEMIWFMLSGQSTRRN